MERLSIIKVLMIQNLAIDQWNEINKKLKSFSEKLVRLF